MLENRERLAWVFTGMALMLFLAWLWPDTGRSQGVPTRSRLSQDASDSMKWRLVVGEIRAPSIVTHVEPFGAGVKCIDNKGNHHILFGSVYLYARK